MTLLGLCHVLYEPGSKLVVLGMVIPPLIGNPYNGYINPYYWVDDHPLIYGNNGSLDPSTCPVSSFCIVSCDFSTLQGSRRPVSKGHLHPSYHLFTQTHIIGHWKYHNAVCPWRHEQQRVPHITTSTSSTQRIVKPAKNTSSSISKTRTVPLPYHHLQLL